MGNAQEETVVEASRSAPITKSDTEPQPRMRAIHVGTGGNIVGQLRGDTEDRTFICGAGLWPYDFKLIKDASTAAAMIAIL